MTYGRGQLDIEIRDRLTGRQDALQRLLQTRRQFRSRLHQGAAQMRRDVRSIHVFERLIDPNEAMRGICHRHPNGASGGQHPPQIGELPADVWNQHDRPPFASPLTGWVPPVTARLVAAESEVRSVLRGWMRLAPVWPDVKYVQRLYYYRLQRPVGRPICRVPCVTAVGAGRSACPRSPTTSGAGRSRWDRSRSSPRPSRQVAP